MRIAHVTATFPPYEGGTGRVAYFNALELARLGHQVSVITAATSQETVNYPPEIKIVRLPVLFGIGNAPVLPGLLHLPRVDIIHLHYPFITGAELMWWAARSQRIPYVITHHNDLIGTGVRRIIFDLYSTLTSRTIMQGARRYITVSLDHAAHCQLSPLFRARWQDVVEISNGVDTKIFNPEHDGSAVRARFSIPADALVVGFVGSLDLAHHFKRVDRVIEAFARLNAPNSYLLIVGEGDMQPMLMNLSQASGVADRVIFAGKVPHEALASYYAALDMLVLASSPPESFGMVLIEAGACGKPVIASDIPGVRSVVENNETGILVADGDIIALTSALGRLMDNPLMRAQMGAAGYKRVHARYTWPAVARQLETVYLQVLDQKI